MNTKMIKAMQKTAADVAASEPTLANYLHALAKEAEVKGNTVDTKAKSENTIPSSASGTGMEKRNKNYGQAAEDLDPLKNIADKKKGDSIETGEVKTEGADLTTESSGIPPKALNPNWNKQAALLEIRKGSLKRRLAALA